MNLLNFEDLEKLIINISPKFIINCAGILNDKTTQNTYNSIKINSLLPRFLEMKSSLYDYNLIHLSTDCVYNGKKGSYKITDQPDGLGTYAITKILGEVTENSLTIRTSIIGPEIKKNGIGLFHWFYNNYKKKIEGYCNVYWSGVTTFQLAKTINSIIKDYNTGLLILTNNKKINKYDLLQNISKTFCLDAKIKKNYSFKSDKSLITSELVLNKYKIPDYDIMLKELKEWMKMNSKIYTFYENLDY